MTKKALIWIAVIALCYLLFFPIPIPMHREVQGVEIQLGDPSACIPVTIKLDGTYRWYLLAADTFTGAIRFSGYPLTEEEPLAQGKGLPTLKFEQGSDLLEYGEWMEAECFGWILVKGCMSSIVVQVMEKTEGSKGGSWSTADGRCIVAPASAREEALAVLRRFEGNERLPPYEYWLEE